MTVAEAEDFRDDKQMMLLAKSRLQLQLYGCYKKYNDNATTLSIHLSIYLSPGKQDMRTYTSVSDCHFNKLPSANKIYVLSVTKKVLKKPI